MFCMLLRSSNEFQVKSAVLSILLSAYTEKHILHTSSDTLHLLTVYFAHIFCVVFDPSSLKKFYESV